MDGKQLQSQYKDHLSDFQNWDQRAHAQEYILYPKNMGYHLCIDETALSKGDLYTILINRDKRGRKGSIIAVIQGTKTDDIIAVLTKMPQELRNQVKEITLDMAGSMQKIAKTCFPRAMQVIDRFHVQKLVYEAVQELRITYRWQVIKEENKAMKAAKEKGEVYKADNSYGNQQYSQYQIRKFHGIRFQLDIGLPASRIIYRKGLSRVMSSAKDELTQKHGSDKSSESIERLRQIQSAGSCFGGS